MRQMNFKLWLESEADDNYVRWKDIITGYLNLDPQNGLSQPLNTFNSNNLKEKLKGLGEFGKLPVDVQQKVLGMIDGPQGTVGDLVRMIAGEPRINV